MKLAMTVTVKAMDTHRWNCRIQLLQLNVTSLADSDRERTLFRKRRHWTERKEVRRLRRWHSRLDRRVEIHVVAVLGVEAPVVPNPQQLLCERAVVIAVERGLIVLGAGDQYHSRLDHSRETGEPGAAGRVQFQQCSVRVGIAGAAAGVARD